MGDEHASNLPLYEAKRSKDFPDYLLVFCPYEDCTSKQEVPFLVHYKTWMRPLRRVSRSGKPYQITGRSCPYCFRVAKIPSRAGLR